MSGETREPWVMSGLDLREMTFQNVIDNILRPSGIKIGGFPEELFLDLTEREHQDMMCNVCFLIANECRLCDNEHVFCHSCIVAWSMTFGENAHKCPVCRRDQSEYNASGELDRRISSKQVRCMQEGCGFQSTLADYLLHGHGKAAYSNAHVDFGCLRQQLFRPSSATENSSQGGLGLSTSIRSQLLQSRTMIQQMMMLMRIEMQLRQQAMFNFQHSPDPDADRARGLDDALALNNQLSEISSVLATLIRSTSVGQRSGRRRPPHRDLPGPQRLRRADGSGFARSAALRRLSNLSTRQWRETDSVANDDLSVTDDNDDDSGDDEEILDMNNSVSENIVDDFIWQQLNESAAETGVDNIRSSPDGMSVISSLPHIQSMSSIQSIPSNQSLASISSVQSDQSLSSISNVTSYASLVSPSVMYEDGQITPGYVLCMNNCHGVAAEGQCLCQVCAAFDSVAVVGADEADEVVPTSQRDVRPQPSLAGEPRQRVSHLSDPSTCAEIGAAVGEPHSSESEMNNTLRVEPTGAIRRTLQPIVPAGRDVPALQTALPAVGRESSRQSVVNSSLLSLLPGTRRPPRPNYAGRLQNQATEMSHLPSEVSIRPWPLPDAGRAAVGNRRTSPALSGLAARARGSARQLPTYLPPRQSPAVASTALQAGSAYRATRPSRYNTAVSRDHTRLPRP